MPLSGGRLMEACTSDMSTSLAASYQTHTFQSASQATSCRFSQLVEQSEVVNKNETGWTGRSVSNDLRR